MKTQLGLLLKKYTIVPVLLIFFLIFSVTTKNFFTFGNISNIVLQSSIYGIMAIGMTFLMINGFFDLSVGTVMGLSANLVIGLQPIGLFWSILAGIIVGLVFGIINGLLVVKARINAFIVTLSSMVGARGLIYIYSKERSIIGTTQSFGDFALSGFLGLPTMAWIFIILLIAGAFVLKKTSHGRNTYAVGGNTEAAYNAGINTDRTTIVNFIICSIAAGLGGILMASRMNSANPMMGWPDTNLTIISIVVLGGTSLSGGSGAMLNTLGGALTICMIQNALNLLHVQTYYNSIIMGVILILIVFIDQVLKRNKIVKM